MIYILSLDNPLPGKSSSMGIRAWQLYKLCQAIKGKKNVRLVVSTSIKDKFEGENIIRYQYPDSDGSVFCFGGLIKSGDTVIVPINAYNYPLDFSPLKSKDINLIVDLIAPVFSEGLFMDMPDIIRIQRGVKIGKLLSAANCFILGNQSQNNYWQGILSAFHLMGRDGFNIHNLPLYLPFDGKKRLKFANNKTLLFYGCGYQWTDWEAIFKLFKRMPSDYYIHFKGLGHPLYERSKSLGEYIVEAYVKTLSKGKRKHIIVDPTWNNKVIECNAGICLTKKGECEVSYKIRGCDFFSNEIPIITNTKDNLWNIFYDSGMRGTLINDDSKMEWIEHCLYEPISFEYNDYEMEIYSFDNVAKYCMGLLE